ncbi:MAG TPA: hypothetical protein VIL49_03145, partial [Capillimicrobium sp.]
MSERTAVVVTHRRAEEVREAMHVLERVADEAGVRLRLGDVDDDAAADQGASIAIALGGDGTIL